MVAVIAVVVANQDELPAAQRFYALRGYAGAAIVPSDFVVLARHLDEIVGIGRLCEEQDVLWLRGMQVAPAFQRSGVGSRILQRLGQEIGRRCCCCLPHDHLVNFYRQAGFEPASENLPADLCARRASYLARGLKIVAMVRPAQTRFALSPETEGSSTTQPKH